MQFENLGVPKPTWNRISMVKLNFERLHNERYRMNFALLASTIALFTTQQDVPTKTFTEPYLGMQFTYPTTWVMEKTTTPTLTGSKKPSKRKPKVDKSRTLFLIPIENSLNKAELEVVRTEYHASIDLWQTIQLRESELDKTQIVRQWEQDILGVPMLFSRIDLGQKGGGNSAIVGLFYTRSSFKLLLRLTAPTSEIDKVTYQFNKMLETLRYTDGKLPQEDDPSIDLDPVGKKLVPVAPTPRIIDAPTKGPKVLFKAPVTADLVVSTRKITLRLPQSWVPEQAKDNVVDLKEASLTAPLHLQVFSSLDSDLAPTALLKLAAKDLNEYTTVASREDSSQKINSAGCTVATVWREGKSSSGDLIVGHASGSMGEYYFLLTYRQTDKALAKADRKVIEALLKQISLETNP